MRNVPARAVSFASMSKRNVWEFHKFSISEDGVYDQIPSIYIDYNIFLDCSDCTTDNSTDPMDIQIWGSTRSWSGYPSCLHVQNPP